MSEIRLVAGVLLSMSLFVGGGIYLGNYLAQVQCRNTATAMGAEYTFGPLTPCMVKLPGKPWAPLRAYRAY